MLQSLPVALGVRYLRAKKRSNFLSLMSFASILGIALGVMATITVISVMSGFQEELKNRILGMVAHATMSGVDGPMNNWEHALTVAKQHPEVQGAAPYVERESLLQGRRVYGALLKGIDPDQEAAVSKLPEYMKEGELQTLESKEFNILLGTELAMMLGVNVGDAVTVYVPEFKTTPVGVLPQTKRFTVSGIFEAGMQDYDAKLAIIHIGDAQRLMRMRQGVSGVRLKLDDMYAGWKVAREISSQLDDGFVQVRDWSRDHANFFRAIKMEKTAMFIVLSLIIAVAAFNVVSSLGMLVNDKQADIAILRTLGMTPKEIMNVFMIQGTLIGVVGAVIGVVGGILLTLNLGNIIGLIEKIFGVSLMPTDVYYITGFPTDLRASEVALIAFVALFLSVIATLYPAWRASRTDPAAALRYE